jgi:hypothetical protein
MALRVARGLFRLWLVLSVLWIGGVGVVTWREYPDEGPDKNGSHHCRPFAYRAT